MKISLTEIRRRNESRLNGLHPLVRDKAEKLIKKAYDRGVLILITQGFRSRQEQQRLFNQGRITPGRIVTNARPGYSYHNYGLAVDFCIYNQDGTRLIWSTTVDQDRDGKADWLEVAEEGKKLGFEWGGDWSGFVDNPHLQYTFGLSITELRSGKRPPKHENAPLDDGLLENGDHGPAVTALQNELIELGYKLPVYGADGDFGDETEAAVKRFQKDQRIDVDGIVGPQTRKEMAEELAEKRAPKQKAVRPYPGHTFELRDPFMKDEGGESDIHAIQRGYNNAGANLEVDGVFGPATDRETREYQGRHGLKRDGIVGLMTWNTLF